MSLPPREYLPAAEARTVAPIDEPISIDEVKTHCRIIHSTEDASIVGMITAARERCEEYLWRALITQTWEFVYDQFPCGHMLLPRAPLQSVASIAYIDANGAAQTLASNQYLLETRGVMGRIAPAYAVTWPETQDRISTVTVTAVCGYGHFDKVPWAIRAAMLMIVGHLWEHREEVSDFPAHEMPQSVCALLHPYKVKRI
jgi:uncharacterized phiE125 gp8 family phage protein